MRLPLIKYWQFFLKRKEELEELAANIYNIWQTGKS